MKPLLVLCGILTVMATTFAQETATLEIPEPGDGGPSLRVLGDADVKNKLTVDNGLSVTGGKIVLDGETTTAALIDYRKMMEKLIGLKVFSENTNDYAYSSTGIRTEAKGKSTNYGIWSTASDGKENWAGWFEGNTRINSGALHVTGPGLMTIDGTEANVGVTSEVKSNYERTIGLHGSAQNDWDLGISSIGVSGIANSQSPNIESYGIKASAQGKGTNYGIHSVARNGQVNWAGWFEGDVKVTNELRTRNLDIEERLSIDGGLWIDGTGANLEPDNERASFGGLINVSTSNHFVEGIRINSANAENGKTVGVSATALSTFPLKSDANPETFGVTSSAHGKGINYGVWASASGGKKNYAGWFEGDVYVSGKLKIDQWTISQVPDYVFKKDYKLRSLQEVEEYVTEKNHLPEVPSAEEIQKNGLDLAEMNMTLLKKVEELTLYTIQQQKQIDELKARLDR